MSVTSIVKRNDDIEVLSVSAREWRVRDGALPANDATSLLGFVAQVGDVYEVVLIGMPMTRLYMDSLDGAVDRLVERSGRPSGGAVA